MDPISKQQLIKGAGPTGVRPDFDCPPDSGASELPGVLNERLNLFPDLCFALDEHGRCIAINAAVAAFGYRRQELLGHVFSHWLHPDDRGRLIEACRQAMDRKTNCSGYHRFRFLTRSGPSRWFEAHSAIYFGADGAFLAHVGICRDITRHITDQQALENQVRIRSAELLGANEALRKEITERRETEQVLRDREADLEMEKMQLQETNTALKVLLKRRDADRRELEEQVVYNVMKLVLPYLDKLRIKLTDEQQLAYLSILEANLDDITGGFARRLSLEYYNLTSAELKVANFIRQGKRSPEIARLMGLSKRTVEAHRQGIRRKLRILNKKVNLRTFLLAIS